MQKIYAYIKNAKGIGALWIFIFAALVAFSSAYSAKKFFPLAIPYIQEFADTFLPIKIQDGKVMVPNSTIIFKTYHIGGEPFVVELNTTTDILSEGEHKSGIYLTRSYLYSVTDNKIQRQKLTTNINLKKQNYVPLLNDFIEYIVWIILIAGPFFNFICFMIAVVFYAFLTEFACYLNKVTIPFKQRMRLNTVLFIGVYIISTLGYHIGFYLSTLSFFLIMLALQIILVNPSLETIEQQKKN